MSKNIIIGFDPGHKGGIAILNGGADIFPMPLMGKEVDWNRVYEFVWPRIMDLQGACTVFVEKCHSMPGQGVASAFKFGRAYEGIFGMLAAMTIDARIVTPQAWKKVILAGTAKDKPAAIAYCRRRWPSVSLIPEGRRVAHDGMADALCIAAYGETVLGKEQ